MNQTDDREQPKRAIIAGPERGIESALTARDVTVTRIRDSVTADELEAAGAAETSLLVLTDTEDAIAVPIAKDLNPSIRVVFYTADSLPEFVKAQLDLQIDPDLLDADTVAAELVGGMETPSTD
ncbi:MAG: CTP synthetase [Halodesulfurarchaeum sp.]